ncbi:MAG: SLBB domain-containing protein, partial [Candidatus Poribacteria bacterium]|nr:SLBB domain-containing protein [Candidatus Poribacteria bacterium]
MYRDPFRKHILQTAVLILSLFLFTSAGFSQTDTPSPPLSQSNPDEEDESPPSSSERSATEEERASQTVEEPEATEAESEEPDVEKTEEAKTEEDPLPDQVSDARLRRFGYDYFEGARQRIHNLERTLVDEGIPPASIKDAISGFVGPIDMMKGNVNAVVPHSRILRPGDRLTLIYWSEQSPLERREVVVDQQGNVILAEVGSLVARGMTLDQFEQAAQNALSRKQFADLKLIATLDALHTIQIFITGYSFRPGSYATSAVTTLFNALYLSGGPSADGALRDIRLLRNGETTGVDFYRYLMSGDSSQDIPLMAGDTIFIGPVGRLITIEGEVKRPETYELSPDEDFNTLIEMAGGLRPTGFAKRIRIDSVVPNQERVLRDLDVSTEPRPNPPLYDGDRVQILPILDEVLNVVQLEGKVSRPGSYELTSGMRISDLIAKAEDVLEEAYLPRADLFRLNADGKTTTLIPIDLARALSNDEVHDIRLRQRDRFVVYSRWDVQWIAERIVNAQGAVQSPGSFERSDDMHISDLLMRAGGVLPEAHLEQAILFRLNERRQIAEGIPVNLEAALRKDPTANLLLKDGDALVVQRFDEVRWVPNREVTITGAVLRPGTYLRLDNMRVSQLLFQAGGILPQTATTALLMRRNEQWEVAESLVVDLAGALEKQRQADIALQDGDNLIVYTEAEREWKAPREVSITGAVQLPGAYRRVDGMRVGDLLFRAGGVLPNAHIERVDLRRYLADAERLETISVDLSKVMAGDTDADLLLQDRDSVIVSTIREAAYYPERVVTVYGAVQRPDTYMRTENMRVSDLLFVAGGVLPGTRETIEVARARG